ncbi:Peptidoglycan L-alanyl-D-glutamate endopeptidase CwlK precursor [compost metagenome]
MTIKLVELMEKNAKKLTGVHPKVVYYVEKTVEKAYIEGIYVLITQGLRTIAEQDALYAQGRTTPGSIVTNAKGGTSFHNYGLGVDYALLSANGSTVSWTVNDAWRRVAEIAKSFGFEWGGDWTSFKDYPHIQMTFGLTIRDLQAGKQPPVWTVPVETEPEEDEDNMAMNLPAYAWIMIQKYVGNAYNDKIITDYAWVEKALKNKLTTAEYAFISSVIEVKRRGGAAEFN